MVVPKASPDIRQEGSKLMIKILFLIHDLGQGGAEKVLVNLVNNMDRSKFDISVTVLFGGGVNEQFLASDIHFRAVFPKEVPGNSKLMKLLTPAQLHQMCVKSITILRSPIWKVLLRALSVVAKTRIPSSYRGFMWSSIRWNACQAHSAVSAKRASATTALTRLCAFRSMSMTIFAAF